MAGLRRLLDFLQSYRLPRLRRAALPVIVAMVKLSICDYSVAGLVCVIAPLFTYL